MRGAQRRSNPEHTPGTGLLRFARNDEIKFRSRGAMRARGLLYNEANSQSPREKEGSGAPKGASNQCPRRIGLRHHEPMHGARKRALAEARSPSGAPLRHLPRLLPLGSAPGRASWNYRVQTGGPSPAPVQRAPRGPVIMPAGTMPEAARVRGYEPRPREPLLAPLSGSSLETPSMSKIGRNVTEQRTDVNNRSPISRHIIVIYFLPRRRHPRSP